MIAKSSLPLPIACQVYLKSLEVAHHVPHRYLNVASAATSRVDAAEYGVGSVADRGGHFV